MEHLYRLVNKDKVVGYMKLEGGKIYHLHLMPHPAYGDKLPKEIWVDVCSLITEHEIRCGDKPSCAYIPHDRIDQYTGIELKDEAKTKVFERDKAKTAGRSKEYTGTVKYSDDFQWMLLLDEKQGFHAAPVWFLAQHEDAEFEIIGIQGVK